MPPKPPRAAHCSWPGPFCEPADGRSLLGVRRGNVLLFIKPVPSRWLQIPPQRKEESINYLFPEPKPCLQKLPEHNHFAGPRGCSCQSSSRSDSKRSFNQMSPFPVCEMETVFPLSFLRRGLRDTEWKFLGAMIFYLQPSVQSLLTLCIEMVND